jgi:hypothetical protein
MDFVCNINILIHQKTKKDIVACTEPLLVYGTVKIYQSNNHCTRERGTRHVCLCSDVTQQ